MEQIENEKDSSESLLTGELFTPNERVHLFKTLDALFDFCRAFRVQNGNFRSGVVPNGTSSGERVYQLVYQSEQE